MDDSLRVNNVEWNFFFLVRAKCAFDMNATHKSNASIRSSNAFRNALIQIDCDDAE